jgi:hypothetical protein
VLSPGSVCPNILDLNDPIEQNLIWSEVCAPVIVPERLEH